MQAGSLPAEPLGKPQIHMCVSVCVCVCVCVCVADSHCCTAEINTAL